MKRINMSRRMTGHPSVKLEDTAELRERERGGITEKN